MLGMLVKQFAPDLNIDEIKDQLINALNTFNDLCERVKRIEQQNAEMREIIKLSLKEVDDAGNSGDK
ncbi:MAG: hypothetical protein ACYDAO_09355 [Thermoplasmataceae archaeon]